jgi:hypothetical protein
MRDEGECTGKVKFKSLTDELKPWVDSALGELPEELRDRIKQELPLAAVVWDSLLSCQRSHAAAESDCKHDPANKAENEAAWDLAALAACRT